MQYLNFKDEDVHQLIVNKLQREGVLVSSLSKDEMINLVRDATTELRRQRKVCILCGGDETDLYSIPLKGHVHSRCHLNHQFAAIQPSLQTA